MCLKGASTPSTTRPVCPRGALTCHAGGDAAAGKRPSLCVSVCSRTRGRRAPGELPRGRFACHAKRSSTCGLSVFWVAADDRHPPGAAPRAAGPRGAAGARHACGGPQWGVSARGGLAYGASRTVRLADCGGASKAAAHRAGPPGPPPPPVPFRSLQDFLRCPSSTGLHDPRAFPAFLVARGPYLARRRARARARFRVGKVRGRLFRRPGGAGPGPRMTPRANPRLRSPGAAPGPSDGTGVVRRPRRPSATRGGGAFAARAARDRNGDAISAPAPPRALIRAARHAPQASLAGRSRRRSTSRRPLRAVEGPPAHG